MSDPEAIERQARRWAVSLYRDQNPSEQDVEDSYSGLFDACPRYADHLEAMRDKASKFLAAKEAAFSRSHREMGTAQARMSRPAVVGDR